MIASIKKYIPYSVKKGLKLLLFKGNKVVCPFCGYRAKDLIWIKDAPKSSEHLDIIGWGVRKGACLKCGSRDRERLVYVYLKEELNILENGSDLRILHIAPEPRISNILKNSPIKEYLCGDMFTDGYEYPEYVSNMDVTDLPFDENSFDLVICNHVLEHVPEDQIAMREIYRVIKNRGKAVLQVPIARHEEKTIEDPSITDPKERERRFGQFDHVRLYGHDYVKRLEKNGFQVERVNISRKYAEYGLNPDEDLFVARKR